MSERSVDLSAFGGSRQIEATGLKGKVNRAVGRKSARPRPTPKAMADGVRSNPATEDGKAGAASAQFRFDTSLAAGSFIELWFLNWSDM